MRPATAADAPAVAIIWHRGWRDGHEGKVSDELVSARTEESFRSRASRRVADTTVATVGGAVAGFIMVADDEVEQVYVAEAHRGTGVAAALLARAEEIVAGNGHESRHGSRWSTATPERDASTNATAGSTVDSSSIRPPPTAARS